MELNYSEIINHTEVKTTSSLINLIHGMEKNIRSLCMYTMHAICSAVFI